MLYCFYIFLITMKKFSINYLYLLIWIGIILYGSLSANATETPLFSFPHLDKIAHFGMYFGLTFLLIPIQSGKNKKVNSNAILLAIAFGLLMELIQFSMHTGRQASVYDAIANTIGSILGLLFYRKIFENSRLDQLLFKN